MKMRRVLRVRLAVFLTLVLTACWFLSGLAAESQGQKAVNKELQQEIGIPILSGELWQKMNHDDKVAFIWGFWHAVSIEEYLMSKYPELKRESFSAKVIESSNKTRMNINEIVSLIDQYYQANPDGMGKPVVAVLWDKMIKPNIKTGIAGHPLKP